MEVDAGKLAKEKSEPAPPNVTVCGLPGALSVIVSDPVLVPVVVGVNVILMVQFADVAKVAPQVVVVSANGPVTAMLVIVSDAVPVLLSVTVCAALVAPGGSEGNVKLLAETVTAGADTAPPNRVTDCGLFGALSVMTTVPLALPEAVGVKATLMVQDAPAATDAPQVFVSPKGGVEVILAMVSAAPPELVNVTVWAALVVPMGSAANVRLVGESVTLGSKTPVPDKAKLCGELEALSTTVTDARRTPAAVGVKVIANAQPAPPARVEGLKGQVFCETAKSEAFSPVTVMLVIVSAAPPEFVRITDWALLVVFTGWLAKMMLVGARVTPGAAAPIPARATVCGLFAALSVTVNMP
jgi:hypothetical protein